MATNTLTQRLRDTLHLARWHLNARTRFKQVFPFVDWAMAPLSTLGAAHFLALRRLGIDRMPVNRKLLQKIGLYPVRAHYYDPLVQPNSLDHDLGDPRTLPGFEMGTDEQLKLLKKFKFQQELDTIPMEQKGPTTFGFQNGTYYVGDAAMLYNMLRTFKPKRLLEVGAGNSTLMARLALQQNALEGAVCRHQCIEPFEMSWLESVEVEVIRQKVETVDLSHFTDLEAGDVLFIDSSHMVRPQGDVLFLYQNVLPRLKPGVIVHIHDIFTPRDYPKVWVLDRMLFWNEQYVLEAFLAFNKQFEVLAAVNHLYRDHFEALAAACPVQGRHPESEPTSFWMRRV